MARDSQAAIVALNRFGFGARGGAAGDLANAAADPRGFLKAELTRPESVLIEVPGLQSTQALAQTMFNYQFQVRQAREAANTALPSGDRASDSKAKDSKANEPLAARAQNATGQAVNMAGGLAPTNNGASMTPNNSNAASANDALASPAQLPSATPGQQADQALGNVIQKTYRAEALARIQRASIAECGFAERLVTFWSNHFCISANKGQPARMWAGSFEREAIRPHVLGKFADMLKAVEQHPAMLFFLDNQQSLGPESRAGQTRKRGLNENLAREILELHTLGVGGGYTQEDVTSLARIITGWTYAGREGKLGTPGSFIFNANAHEPGPQRLLGRNYDPDGIAQGEAALTDIARHSSTAKFIATKFARHFVADEPPPTLVARLQDVFAKTDGDLKALAIALVDSNEAWQTPMTKMRSPYEYLIATGRLLGRIPDNANVYLGGLNLLGQPLWTPTGPNGFPDTVAAWAAPEGMKLRLDIASQVSSKIAESVDPRDLLELVAADAASPETRRTIERAESRQQALALLLMSPEFQRR